MNKIKEVLEKVYSNMELRNKVVPLFMSDPGLGKSQIIREFAKEKNVKLVPFITSQRNPFEISGLAMPDKDTKKMSFWDFDTLLEMKDGDILFFDEAFNGNIITLNACLTILEEREMISGKKLPNIMIVAAANPQGMVPLTPQIKERFIWYEVKFHSEMWQNYMWDKYKMPKKISRKLCHLIKSENFKSNNFNSPRSLDKAVNMGINDCPTPYDVTVLPILNTTIKNHFDSDILDENKEVIVAKNEMLQWLKLVRLTRGVHLPLQKKEDDDVRKESYDISMLNERKEEIGLIKGLDVLRSMYYFNDDQISKLRDGEVITPPPPRLFHRHRPHDSISFFNFQKNNINNEIINK